MNKEQQSTDSKKNTRFVKNKKTKEPFKRKILVSDIDYKNPEFLSKFVGKRHSILSKKYTHLSSKLQRKVAAEIKKARILGLLKYTDRQ